MLPNRLHAYQTAPLADLLAVLLRQFRRPLLTHGAAFSDADAAELAAALVARADHPLRERVRPALLAVIADGEAVLARLGLTFPASLDTPMDAIGGWETTADFLDLANDKANAELRISAGSPLAFAFGDRTYHAYVTALAARPPTDLDGLIARRVLAELP